MGKASKKIFVTGGAGFIGSNFIRYLYNKYPSYQLYNFDFLTYAGNLDNLTDIVEFESKKKAGEKRYHFIKGDICEPVLVGKTLQKIKPDIVVNFAAESHVDRSIIDSRYFFRTNVIGVHNLVDIIIKQKIPKFIQISSDEVYGDVLRGVSKETSPLRPSNPYSASKASSDLLVQAHIRTHKLPAIIVRGSNNYGPFQYPEKLIPLAITNLLDSKKIPIHGDGSQKRKWLHVEDFCSAIDLVLHKGKLYNIYNVAGVEMTNLDIIKEISRVLGKDYRKEVIFIKDRPGGDLRYAVDGTKIKKELGWKMKYRVSDELGLVIDWYLNNKQWWKKVRSYKEFKLHYEKQYKSEY